MKKKNRKLRKNGSYTIVVDNRGYKKYQTNTYDGTVDGKKRQIQKSLSVKLTSKEIKTEVELWNKYFDDIDGNYKSKNPFTKPPTPLRYIRDVYVKEQIKKVDLGDISPSTKRINCENLNIFVEWFLDEYDNRNVQRISSKHIEEYRNHRKLKLHNGERLSDNTVRLNLRVVRGFFNWCLDRNYIDRTPFTKDINIPSYSSKPIEDVPLGKDWKKLYEFIERSITFKSKGTDGEKKFQKFNDNDWFKYIIYIMCNSGMRGGEVRMLKWKKGKRDNPSQRNPYSYLNDDFSIIHIFFKGTYGEIKTTSRLRKLFHTLNKTKNKNTYIFQSPITDEPYDKSIFNKMFRQLMVDLDMVKDDGSNKYTPHSIRHSVVSDLINKNIPIGSISKLLRHTSIRTTMDIYSHLLPSDMEEIMDKIGV